MIFHLIGCAVGYEFFHKSLLCVHRKQQKTENMSLLHGWRFQDIAGEETIEQLADEEDDDIVWTVCFPWSSASLFGRLKFKAM